ncbi:MAG: hypothetical protein ABJA98_21380 [Acidobacteriota bacterium]
MPPAPLITLIDPYGTINRALQTMLDVIVPGMETAAQTLVLILIGIMMAHFFYRMMFGDQHITMYAALQRLAAFEAAWVLVRYYRTVPPGFSYSLLGTIDGTMRDWMVLLGRGTVEDMWKNCDLLVGRFVAPTGGIWELLPVLYYFTFIALVSIVKALVIYTTAYGFIGQALTRIWGAPFLAFAIVPKLNQLSWNWFWTYLNYSMLPVMGMAYIFVMTRYVGQAVSVIPPGVTEAGYYTYLGEAMMVLITFILCVPLVRQVTAALTGGTGAAPGMNPFR